MKKAGFWTKDWFFALVIVIVVMGVNATTNFFKALDTKAYDWGVTATSKQPSDRIAIIAIDEQSINNIGRWPWSREIHAAMIDKLSEAKAKVIGETVFFFEPQKDPGLVYINKLLEIYNKGAAPAEPAAVQPGAATAPAPAAITTSTNPALVEFGAVLSEAEQALNTDRTLAMSIKKAGNVILPIILDAKDYPPNGKPDIQVPDYVASSIEIGRAHV